MRSLGLVLAFVLAACGAAAQQRLLSFDTATLEIEARTGRHKFTIELALSSEQQMQGLMFRQRMEADRGMLFLYPQQQPIAMWMANTYIPLDMVFIAADGRISHIVERTVPLSTATIGSGGDALAVLELNGGTAARLGIKTGDRVLYPAFGTGR